MEKTGSRHIKYIKYDRDEVYHKLKETLDWLENVALMDRGTMDHTFGAFQEYFKNIEPILDENGGI